MFFWRTFILMTNIICPQPVTQAQARRFHVLFAKVLEKDHRRCQLCGADEKSVGPKGRAVSLTVAFEVPPHAGGRASEDNMKTICSWCASGLRALASNPIPRQQAGCPSNFKAKMLTLLQHASEEDQRSVLNWLLLKFDLAVMKQ